MSKRSIQQWGINAFRYPRKQHLAYNKISTTLNAIQFSASFTSLMLSAEKALVTTA